MPTGTGGYILLLVYAKKNVKIAGMDGTEPCGAGQDMSPPTLEDPAARFDTMEARMNTRFD